MNKYPVFLDLEDKNCLVVGAGEVAERKIRDLLDAGASVTVVGPAAAPDVAEMARSGRIRWETRDFRPDDAKGAVVVIAATPDTAVNEAVRREATARGALVNVVDRPELCDFFVPAAFSRGRLQIAISTGGASPALAGRLRERLEIEFGPEYADYVEIVSRFRDAVRGRTPDPEERRRAYERLFKSDLIDRVRAGSAVDFEELVERYVG